MRQLEKYSNLLHETWYVIMWQYANYERQLFYHRKNISFAMVAKIVKLF